MREKPPPDEKNARTLLEATISLPPDAHESVPEEQMGAWKLELVVPPAISVAPTDSTYGLEDGKSERVAASAHEGSVRPCAPESPDAASSVTPRVAALANIWLTALTKAREPAGTPTPVHGWTDGEMSHWSSSYCKRWE